MKARPEFVFPAQFDYNTSVPQFNFLRLLSSTARQKFTYLCVNSVGWENAEGTYDMAIELLGSNNDVLTADQSIFTVVEDSCKVTAASYRNLRRTITF